MASKRVSEKEIVVSAPAPVRHKPATPRPPRRSVAAAVAPETATPVLAQVAHLAYSYWEARGYQGDFLVRNLHDYWFQPWAKVGVTSMFLLLFTANGIFEPLEVALNRAWGVTVNRPYWKNQLISLGLVFVCGALALVSLML